MVLSERAQQTLCVFKVVLDQVININEVGSHQEEIPVEDPIKRQVVLLVLGITNGNDLLETFEEDEHHQDGEADGTKVDDDGKGSDQNEGEYSTNEPFSPSWTQDPSFFFSSSRLTGGHLSLLEERLFVCHLSSLHVQIALSRHHKKSCRVYRWCALIGTQFSGRDGILVCCGRRLAFLLPRRRLICISAITSALTRSLLTMYGLIQIPNTSQATDAKGLYTVFNIHLNGYYLGSLRYSQLFSFHQELKANFDCKRLEEFPPKYWRSTLSDELLEERRGMLERFLHSVMQDRVISISDMLKEFLIAIQKSCSDVTDGSSRVEVYLVNGKKVNFEIGSFDRTDQVLERACAEIQVAPELTYYFGLFIEQENTDTNTWSVVRPLTDYECPVVSLDTASKNGSFRITIRKNFWDPTQVPALISDKNAKNLLYIEALNAVALGHWEVGSPTMEQLTAYRKKGQKKEYLEAVSALPQYGYLQLDGLTFDHPEDGLMGSVRIGKMETVTYTSSSEEWGEDLKKCQHYSLTRMKSWKIVHSHGVALLRIHYQYGATDFSWVTIRGDQTVHLALCLHSTVNELLRLRGKQPIRKPGETPISRQPRDFPHVTMYTPPTPPSPAVESVDSAHSSDQSPATPTSDGSASIGQRSTSVSSTENKGGLRQQRLSSSSSAGGMSSASSQRSPAKPKSKSSSKTPKISEAVENPTFEFGGDDDL